MAKDTSGWIKLHRSSFENKLYFSEPFTRWQAWCDLILLANHKEGIYYVRGVQVRVPRGTVGHGINDLRTRWKWSRGKVERFMQYLEHETVKQIVRQKNNVTTLISILNYEKHQTNDNANNTTSSKANGQQTVKQTDTNKNDKELEEGNNYNTLVKPIDEKQKNGTETNIIRSISSKPSGADILADRIFNIGKQAES